jgi:hypothetical protein
MDLPRPVTPNQCKLDCKNNEYIDYDLINSKLTCRQCPYGTFSSVNSTNIIWNEQSFSKFIKKCKINKNDKVVSDCEGFKLNKGINETTVIAGGSIDDDAMHSYQLIYNIELKQDGKVKYSKLRLHLLIKRILFSMIE